MRSILPRSFFARQADLVAAELAGKNLVSVIGGQLTIGRIVETEAYLPAGDPACHAARGKTPGNATMFGKPGLSYVYPIHARCCFNVVVGEAGVGTAVLIRAVKPLYGIDVMQARRCREKLLELCRGPARLCGALGIDRSYDGHDLIDGRTLWIDQRDSVTYSIDQLRVTERIGVTSAKLLKLRFVVPGSRYASGPGRLR